MIGAGVGIFLDAASKLGHCDNRHPLHRIAEIVGECKQGVRQLTRLIGEILNEKIMMIPATEIDRRNLDSEIELDRVRKRLQLI